MTAKFVAFIVIKDDTMTGAKVHSVSKMTKKIQKQNDIVEESSFILE